MRLYAPFSKIDDEADGTLRVYGFASSEATDADGEVISAEAVKAALPDYLKFGAVREMHQPKAAGTALEASVQPDGRLWFGALVVDPEAILKVQTGVYKGFSIGGRVTARAPENPQMITGLSLVEISLVDRPANPEAVFTLVKVLDTAPDIRPDTHAGAADDALNRLDIIDRLAGRLSLMKAERDRLAARVAELEALPMPGGPALRAVPKEADTVSKARQSEMDRIDALPPDQQARALIKLAHQSPKRLI